MGIIGTLIKETEDSSTDLSMVLRRTQVLSRELGSLELREWVGYELNGYKPEVPVPGYRVIPTKNYGNFWGIKGNLLLPLGGLDEETKQKLSVLELRYGIAACSELLRAENEPIAPWDADLVDMLANKFYTSWRLVEAWRPVPKHYLAQVLDSVRNNLLQFVLELKDEHPTINMNDEHLRNVPQEEVKTSVITNIYGGTNVVASGEKIHQEVTQGITANDLDGLLRQLRTLSVPDDLMDELTEEINANRGSIQHGIPPSIQGWIRKLAERVGTNTTVASATQVLLQFFGVSGN